MSALLVLSGSPQRASAPGIAIPSLQAAEPAQTGAADGQRQCEPRSRIPRSSAHGVRRSPLASVFHAKPPPSGAISGPHATARSERAKAPVCTSGSSGLSVRASATPPLRQPPGRPCRLGPPPAHVDPSTRDRHAARHSPPFLRQAHGMSRSPPTACFTRNTVWIAAGRTSVKRDDVVYAPSGGFVTGMTRSGAQHRR